MEGKKERKMVGGLVLLQSLKVVVPKAVCLAPEPKPMPNVDTNSDERIRMVTS